MDPVLVKVRIISGAYLARCGKAVASCTSDAETAAARAAGKALRVLEPHVYLKPCDPTSDRAFWALPVTASDADLVGYKTAHQIATDKAAERDRRYHAERTGPGSYGDRLD
jgi:hypothetical protein